MTSGLSCGIDRGTVTLASGVSRGKKLDLAGGAAEAGSWGGPPTEEAVQPLPAGPIFTRATAGHSAQNAKRKGKHAPMNKTSFLRADSGRKRSGESSLFFWLFL